jgi:hypothetical protein
MSALPRRSHAELLTLLQKHSAIILTKGEPPWRAVPYGDTRRRPLAWISSEALAEWRAAGVVVAHPNKERKIWRVLNRAGPRPITAHTPDGPVSAQVRENWMQRLARDLDLPGPLAEAGHRLVADGLRCTAGSHRVGPPPVVVDSGPQTSNAEENRVIRRLDARKRVRDALDDLRPLERVFAEGICLNDRALLEIAKTQALTETESADIFILALVKLSRTYGTMPGIKKRTR